jgi:hypothetical protein
MYSNNSATGTTVLGSANCPAAGTGEIRDFSSPAGACSSWLVAVADPSEATMPSAPEPPDAVLALETVPIVFPLTFRDDLPEARPLLFALPNQCGNPWRRLNPPGGSRSSSVALTGSSLVELVLNVYVVSGTISG